MMDDQTSPCLRWKTCHLRVIYSLREARGSSSSPGRRRFGLGRVRVKRVRAASSSLAVPRATVDDLPLPTQGVVRFGTSDRLPGDVHPRHVDCHVGLPFRNGRWGGGGLGGRPWIDIRYGSPMECLGMVDSTKNHRNIVKPLQAPLGKVKIEPSERSTDMLSYSLALHPLTPPNPASCSASPPQPSHRTAVLQRPPPAPPPPRFTPTAPHSSSGSKMDTAAAPYRSSNQPCNPGAGTGSTGPPGPASRAVRGASRLGVFRSVSHRRRRSHGEIQCSKVALEVVAHQSFNSRYHALPNNHIVSVLHYTRLTILKVVFDFEG